MQALLSGIICVNVGLNLLINIILLVIHTNLSFMRMNSFLNTHLHQRDANKDEVLQLFGRSPIQVLLQLKHA